MRPVARRVCVGAATWHGALSNDAREVRSKTTTATCESRMYEGMSDRKRSCERAHAAGGRDDWRDGGSRVLAPAPPCPIAASERCRRRRARILRQSPAHIIMPLTAARGGEGRESVARARGCTGRMRLGGAHDANRGGVVTVECVVHESAARAGQALRTTRRAPRVHADRRTSR